MTGTITPSRTVIRIATEFSEIPGPRLIEEGPNSGELFLRDLLGPAFLEAETSKATLLVDLDGTEGYATSFLEQAFGGLAREVGAKRVLEVLRFKSEEEPYLINEIESYIGEA